MATPEDNPPVEGTKRRMHVEDRERERVPGTQSPNFNTRPVVNDDFSNEDDDFSNEDIPVPPPSPRAQRSSETRARMHREIMDVNLDRIKRIYFDETDHLYHNDHQGPNDDAVTAQLKNEHPLGPIDSDSEELEEVLDQPILDEASPLIPIRRNTTTLCHKVCKTIGGLNIFKCRRTCCSPPEDSNIIGDGLLLCSEDKELIQNMKRNPTHGIPIGILPFGTHDVMDFSTCESLNYKTSSCELKLQHDIKLEEGQLLRWKSFFKFWVCVLIAVAVGTLGFGIDQGIKWLAYYKYKFMAQWMEIMFENYSMFAPLGLGITVVNAVIVGFAACMGYLEPVSTGSGIPHIKAYLNGLKVPRLMRFKTLITKALGVIACVVGGMPVGKEGPMIHSGAIIGAGLSQGKNTSFQNSAIINWTVKTFGLDRIGNLFAMFRNDEDKCDFVCCGAAAGVAAAFGAPIGGIIFVLEEGASYLKLPLIFMLLLSSTSSFLALNLLETLTSPESYKSGSYRGFLSFGSFDDSEWDQTQLAVFTLIGVVGGCSGAVFNKCNEMLTKFRMRKVNRSTKTRILEILCWSSVVTVIALALITGIEDCQEDEEFDSHEIQLYCPDGFYHAGASIWFATPESVIKDLLHKPYGHFNITNLTVFTIIYFIISCYTYGLAISSGLFIPCLLVGAGWGRLTGLLLIKYAPFDVGDPGKYALMGAVSQLSGVVRISVCVAAIVSEATGNYTYMPPILVVSIVSKVVGDWFSHGIYEIHNDLSGVPLLEADPPSGTSTFKATNIMANPVVCFPERAGLDYVDHIMRSTSHSGFPIVGDQGVSSNNLRDDYQKKPDHEGQLTGFVLRTDIAFMIYGGFPKERHPRMSNPDPPTWKDYTSLYPRYITDYNPALYRSHVQYLDFHDIMDPGVVAIHESMDLQRVYKLVRDCGIRHLVVTDDRRNVRGMVTRKDMYQFVNHSWLWRKKDLQKRTSVIKGRGCWVVIC